MPLSMIVGGVESTERFALCVAVPHAPVVSTVYVPASPAWTLLIVNVLLVLVFVIVKRPPLTMGTAPFFQTKLNGAVPEALVVKLAVAPSQTATSGGSLVAVFAFTVSVADCDALPQVPVVVTATV